MPWWYLGLYHDRMLKSKWLWKTSSHSGALKHTYQHTFHVRFFFGKRFSNQSWRCGSLPPISGAGSPIVSGYGCAYRQLGCSNQCGKYTTSEFIYEHANFLDFGVLALEACFHSFLTLFVAWNCGKTRKWVRLFWNCFIDTACVNVHVMMILYESTTRLTMTSYVA